MTDASCLDARSEEELRLRRLDFRGPRAQWPKQCDCEKSSRAVLKLLVKTRKGHDAK
jgi:hypothetical protein